MSKTISTFAAGFFVVWYLPAAKAAITGDAGPWVAAMLAGVVVALPITVLASVGAIIGFLVVRSSTKVLVWQSVVTGVICGILTTVITWTPKAPSSAFLVASHFWSGVPVLLRVVLSGAIVGVVMFKGAQLINGQVKG